jgi:mono/diheme cytochrome c family protein
MAEGAASPMVNLMAGMENYDVLQCDICHGAMGGGGTSGRALNNYALGGTPAYATFSVLQAKIHTSMPRMGGNPPQSPSDCENACADDVSGYIYCEWNSGLVTSGCPVP